MEIKVVIADDEPLARQLLLGLTDVQQGLKIVGIADSGTAAKRIIREAEPDLVFLDVNMPGLSGIELAETFRRLPVAPLVIFVTAFDRFAARAFDLDALDYLVKPIERHRFDRAVERARNAVTARRVQELGRQIAEVASPDAQTAVTDTPYVVIRQRDELVRIAEHDIYWLEAASQYVNIHTETERYVVAEPLKHYFAKLSSAEFKRVHRSAVVNVRKVRRVLRKPNGVHELELANGARVSLSRSRKVLVEELLGATAMNRYAQH